MRLARQQPDASAETTNEEPVPRPRPAAVELAAAVLVVTGAVQLFSALVAAPGAPGGQGGSVALAIGLNFATIAIGLIVRTGRLWLLAVNYVAVLGFLDLLGAPLSPISFMLALADVLVLVALMANRPWFQPPGRDDSQP